MLTSVSDLVFVFLDHFGAVDFGELVLIFSAKDSVGLVPIQNLN